MRPVYHYRPWRIQAHVTLSVLALLLERIVEIRTGDTWRNVAAQLASLKVVEYDRGEARIQQTIDLLFRLMDQFDLREAHSYVKIKHVMVCRELEFEVLPRLIELTEAAAADLGLIPPIEEEEDA